MSYKNKETVKKVNDAFESNNIEGFLEHCTDEVRWLMVGDKDLKGKDEIRSYITEMEGMKPPKIISLQIIAEGDNVAENGEMTMEDKDGKVIAYAFNDVYTFEGDKISELKSYVIKT